MEVKVLENVLAANDAIAGENRQALKDNGVFAVNLMASPGAGKTSFILATLEQLKDEIGIAVIEGDITSKVDAEKVLAHGVEAVQINTGGSCHLDANMIRNGVGALELADFDLIIIENVGNLVCPASFDLGEDMKIMILSIPEGDDKPLKYPLMFSECEALILNKIDLLSLSDFSMDRLKEAVAGLNPGMKLFPMSCKTGEGVADWVAWFKERMGR